jgi:hypothetical protein
MSPSLNEAAQMAVPQMPAPMPKSGHGGLWAVIMLIVGLVIGGGAAWWYAGQDSGAPYAMESATPSPGSEPQVTALPPASGTSFDQTTCQGQECTFDIRITDAAGVYQTIGTTTVQNRLRPQEVGSGSGWAVFTRPVDGLGGYYLFGRHINLTYANLSGAIVDMHEGLVADIAFSSDYAQAATVSRTQAGTYELKLWDLATGASTLTMPVPSTGEGHQAGAPAFSPDGGSLAVAVGYGPDNERGEIYSMGIGVMPEFTKLADTPRPPRELWWKGDGTIAWR